MSGKPKLRVCIWCRTLQPAQSMLGLRVDHKTGAVNLITPGLSKSFGRSAYLCLQKNCVEQALKNQRLKHALEGSAKQSGKKRRIAWPLDEQIIKLALSACADRAKT